MIQTEALLPALREAGLQEAKVFVPVEWVEGRGWVGHLL